MNISFVNAFEVFNPFEKSSLNFTFEPELVKFILGQFAPLDTKTNLLLFE